MILSFHDLLELNGSLQEAANLKGWKGKSIVRLARTVIRVKDALHPFFSSRDMLIAKYGAEKLPNGSLRLPEGTDMASFTAEMEEILSQESDVTLEPVASTDEFITAGATPAMLAATCCLVSDWDSEE